jgi:hypothetical protein
MPETTCCGQRGCGAVVVWARTVRQLDEKTRKMTGGRPMMVDWPLPVYRTQGGRLLAGEDGQPVPNLGVKTDQHGTLLARVLSEAEPLRTDEPGMNAPPVRVPGLLSDESLFPRRRTRRG